jgi:hypothetical protein
MKRVLLLLVALVASQAALCRPNTPQPPPTPQLRTVMVVATDGATHKPLQGATVEGLIEGVRTETNSEGQARVLNVSPDLHQFQLTVRAVGCALYSQSSPLGAGEQTIPVSLDCTPPPPPAQSAGEQFQIHAQGPVFLRSDGTRYLWNGASDFALFQRFQRGEDIDPVLDQRIKAGFTLLRVLGMYEHGIADAAGLPVFSPQSVPEYLPTLQRFVDKLAGRGLRVEFTVFADAQILMPAAAEQQRHLDSVVAAIGDRWNVNFELCNEPFKNGVVVEQLRVPVGLIVASGNYSLENRASEFPHRVYVTVHHDRKFDWPRTARGLDELYNGFDWVENKVVVGHFNGVRVPVVGDEPTGFAEAKDGDKRSEDPNEAAWYAGITVMFGEGATFHSDSGIRSQLFGPKQLAAAEAWNWAMHWVPADAVFAPYQRGDEFGGNGIGMMPLQHFDTWASRTYCKEVGGFEYCIASQPTALWQAQALNGWKIVEQPRLGFVKLARATPPTTVH